jgi:hypothetical protein
MTGRQDRADALARIRETAVPAAPAVLTARYGVEPHDTDALLDLAALAFTHTGWRNTSWEDAHVHGAIDDADQIVANISSWRLVRTGMTAQAWLPYPPKTAAALVAGARDIAGRNLAQRLRGTGVHTKDLRREVREKLWSSTFTADDLGNGALALFALAGAVTCPHWYGTPWWPDHATAFWDALPTQAAGDPPGSPDAARRLLALPDGLDRLRHEPDRLDHPARADLIATGLGYVRLPRHDAPVHAIPDAPTAISAAVFLGM